MIKLFPPVVLCFLLMAETTHSVLGDEDAESGGEKGQEYIQKLRAIIREKQKNQDADRKRKQKEREENYGEEFEGDNYPDPSIMKGGTSDGGFPDSRSRGRGGRYTGSGFGGPIGSLPDSDGSERNKSGEDSEDNSDGRGYKF